MLLKTSGAIFQTQQQLQIQMQLQQLQIQMQPHTSVSTPTPDIWEENDMIWSVDQCPSILWFDGITLDDCQNFCSSVSTCTAINFGEETGHCTLLNCGYPCPEPMWSASNYKGYCLERGKLSFYQRHELLFHTLIIC